MSGILMLAVGLIGQWLLGVAIAAAIFSFRRQIKPEFVEWLGLAFVLGIGGTSWLLFLWALGGGQLGLIPSLLLTVVGFAAGGPIVLFHWRNRKQISSARLDDSRLSRQERALVQLCQFVIGLIFVASFIQTFLTPQKLWDERAIFAIKARVLYEDRSLLSPSLTHPDFVQYHPRYPLLLPLAEEHVYSLLGAVDDRLSKVVFAELYWGMVLTFAGVLHRRYSAGTAWLTALILATTPVLMPYEYGFACGQADAPVACFHGLSVLYLWHGLPRRDQNSFVFTSFAMAAILSAMTAFTKDEGIAYLVIDTTILSVLVITSWFRRSHFRSFALALLMFAVISIGMLVPWFAHRRRLPATTEMNYFGRMSGSLLVSRLDTLNWTVPHLSRRMFWEWREWGLQWWLMLAAAVSDSRRAIRQPQLFLACDVLASLTSLVVAGMLAPAQLDEHIGGSSHRFLMQLAPVAILFAATTFFPEEQLQSPASPSTSIG